MDGGSTPVQRFLFPTVDICSEVELYLRCRGGAWFSKAAGVVTLPKRSRVRFDTYFNSFSVGKWRRHTQLRHLAPYLDAAGSLEVEATLGHPHRAARTVWATRVEAGSRQRLELPPVDLDELGDGQLFLSARCLDEEATLFGGGFTTTDPPAREVRLGAVITTYNRPSYVASNIHRLAQALKETEGYASRLEVLVVDNGGNLDLDLPAWAPVSVVRNRNLGGSGGFAKGLLQLRRSGEFSHALFMDDDIRLDPEVLFRTIDLLSFASDPDLCLAGAMLTEELPYLQFESSGGFRTEALQPFRPIGGQVDLRDRRQVVENEQERRSSYGGWWYFAFPLHLTAANPLPVFVRGDDVCFGLRHAGPHTTTVNGIGVWHQAFDQKNGPAAFYYETRNLALVGALASDRFSARHLAQRFVYQTTRMLMALKYDTAEACIEGMRHFLEGPEAWLARDAEQTNGEVQDHAGDRPAPLPPPQLAVGAFRPTSPLVTKGGGALSALLLSGHLLPRRLSRRPPVGVELAAWSAAAVFGREEVVYRYEPTGEGFVAVRNRARFFGLLREMLATAALIVRRFRRLKPAYRAAYAEMTSDTYWERQFR